MDKLYLSERPYTIIRGKRAVEAEIFAAQELAEYFQKITGKALPIRTDGDAESETEIVIGETDRKDTPAAENLGEDGFIIRTVGEKLFLTGGSPRGTLYAVYEWLESYLGCRFYASDFEKIPHMDSVVLGPIDDRQVPVFTVRNDFWSDYIRNVGFAAKRKMNGNKGPSLPQKYGGSMPWAGGGCHTIGGLAGMTGNHTDRQPCLCDESVYQTVLGNVRKLLADNPGARFISVSQNDSTDRGVGCQCEKCLKIYRETGSYAGSFLMFVNRIADEIRDEYPDVIIHTFAYRYTRQAPKGVIPRPNVMVELCSIEACFRHPLAVCTTVGKDHEAADDFSKLIRDWSAICGNLSVWDYTTDFANYNLTFPNFAVLRDNLRLFADNHVKYVFEQGAYQSRNGEFCELRGYLLSKLLWDPYMSDEQYGKIVGEFFRDFYGEGADAVRAYIGLALSETKDKHVSIYISEEDLYPDRVEVNHDAGELPDGSEAEAIRKGSADWTAYTEWFTALKPNILIEKGTIFFKDALNAETDEAIRRNIERSMIQVEVMRSFHQYRVMQSHRKNLEKVLCGFLQPEEAKAICEAVSCREEEAYMEENRKLQKKMMDLGVYFLTEGNSMNGRESFRFNLPVTRW